MGNTPVENERSCVRCGEMLPVNLVLCPNCGSAQPTRRSSNMQNTTSPGRRAPAYAPDSFEERSVRTLKSTFLICLFTGVFGGHRFYTGHWKSGLLQLFTFAFGGWWWLYDLIMIASSNFNDAQGRRIGKTEAEKQGVLQKKKEQRIQEIERGILKKYAVAYLGGFPQNPSSDLNILFTVKTDCFLLEPELAGAQFVAFRIDYDRISNVEIAPRRVTTLEGILGGLDSRQLNQDNNIHITYINDDNFELVIRLEMITGFTVMGQAGVCREFMDFLRTTGITGKFKKVPPQNPSADVGIKEKLEQLSGLHQSGVLSADEFAAKKADLLSKM